MESGKTTEPSFIPFDAWRFGKLDLNKLKHKIDEPHFGLMMFGLNFGLDSMTAEELADCFDALCVCGKAHSAENLGKLRWRMIRMLEQLAAEGDASRTRESGDTKPDPSR